ncbi:MAG: aminotransferase class I/II-fold pyridoxal phosphate-dependent enzyme [Beijerinckiaceae bacterium]|nr:aminotransferase class I/II-fold pyridoxal phosphate-dependent enzyme [Beijerinckiaceae bacterium]MCZ8300038.1 aminotransferase class I/II-fold pyridoxal phosphate-dependent enzyme [Beijerinckiaceae bacterium]
MASPDDSWTARSLAVQAMGKIDEPTRGVVPPIHVTTTFIRDPDNQYRTGNIYGRPDNETVREAESVIAMLEDARSAMVFGSGMSAAVAVFLALKPGDHIVAPKVMYWALRNWLMKDAAEWGLVTDFVDTSDLAAVEAAIQPGTTRLIWLETPANPLWTITDIAGIAEIARRHGVRVAVDSTGATPILTRPLDFGADIVMHSATKYLNGHSDVLAGALATRTEDEFWARIRRVRAIQGLILGPFEAFLLIRGMRTLGLRVKAACENAMALATRFANHADVHDVLYPGLPSHPGHALAARQMTGGFGGMLSIRLRGGEAQAVAAAGKVRLWKRATSLGGVESLIEHRASIEGEGTPCPADLLRLSTGIEDVEDLFGDLDVAIRAARS